MKRFLLGTLTLLVALAGQIGSAQAQRYEPAPPQELDGPELLPPVDQTSPIEQIPPGVPQTTLFPPGCVPPPGYYQPQPLCQPLPGYQAEPGYQQIPEDFALPGYQGMPPCCPPQQGPCGPRPPYCPPQQYEPYYGCIDPPIYAPPARSTTRLLGYTRCGAIDYGSGGYGSGYSGSGYSGGGDFGRASGGGYGYADLCPDCDACPKHGAIVSVAYDSWRGFSDGNWQNNAVRTGLNYGTRLGVISDMTDVGFQIGGSALAANWAGTDYRLSRQQDAQTQGFLTYGFFRHANDHCRWSGAIVQDWMFNDNFGVYAQNPTLSQWRGQVGCALSARNEVGLWGTFRGKSDTKTVLGGPVEWRAINQLSAYYHYKWTPGGADSSIWFGVPEHDRLDGVGSLGDYLVGTSFTAPLNDRWAAYALITYMHQSGHPGPAAAPEDAWNFSIELSFYTAKNARTSTVAGQCWMPLLPVANNGFFLVDTSSSY